MIRRMLVASAAVLFLALAAPLTANAQSVFISAGPTVPVGDFGDLAKLGWMFEGGLIFDVGEEGLWAGVSGSYGQNSHDDEFEGTFLDGRTDLIVGSAVLGYSIPTESSVAPYVWGGGGILVHRFVPEVGDSESDSNFGYQFGAGLSFGSEDASARPYVEARFQGADGSNFVGANVGVTFDVGN